MNYNEYIVLNYINFKAFFLIELLLINLFLIFHRSENSKIVL